MTHETPDVVDLLLGAVSHGPHGEPADARAADALAVALARAVPPVAPPPALRANLLNRLREEPQGLYTQSADTPWEDLPFPGIQRRILFLDRPNNRITFLLRALPGASIPDHHHSGPEEFLLLEGDLRTPDGRLLRAGDYQRSDGDTDHGAQVSPSGCMALLIAPLCDHVA